MRFARLHCEPAAAPLDIDGTMKLGELDFLQLDYARPRWASVNGDVEKLPEAPSGFSQALRALMTTLYLEPSFHVIASAGWESAYDCVERAADELVAGGCGDLPVSAVRGSNLLPILEMLVADGIDLSNSETGARWSELRWPLLAADLQLGAGPLRMAWADGARVTVAGAFDGAAPAVAAAVARFGWSWHDFDRLASAAVAARAAVWHDWPAMESIATDTPEQSLEVPRAVELEASGRARVEVARADPPAVARLQDWLRSSYAPAHGAWRADMQVDAGKVECSATGPRQIAVDGARGKRPDNCWRLEVLYQKGYLAEAMILFRPAADGALRRRIVEAARLHLQAPDDSTGILAVDELRPMGAADGPAWLRIAYQSRSRQACQLVAEQTLRLASAHRPLVDMAAGSPRVHLLCGVWPTRVPRGAVDIAVETRPAREWL